MAQKSLNILTQLLINEATSREGCRTVSGRPLILISLLNPRRNTTLGSAMPASCYIRQRHYNKKYINSKSRKMYFLVMYFLATSLHTGHICASKSFQFMAIWKIVRTTLTLIQSFQVVCMCFFFLSPRKGKSPTTPELQSSIIRTHALTVVMP